MVVEVAELFRDAPGAHSSHRSDLFRLAFPVPILCFGQDLANTSLTIKVRLPAKKHERIAA
jgi:hypothetical protein